MPSHRAEFRHGGTRHGPTSITARGHVAPAAQVHQQEPVVPADDWVERELYRDLRLRHIEREGGLSGHRAGPEEKQE